MSRAKDVKLVNLADREFISALADRNLAELWQDWHAVHARLRLVSAEANLGQIPRDARLMASASS